MDLTRLGIAGAPSVEISDLAYDTRSVTPGALFFCIKGSRVDGHDLAGAAVAAGAAALVVERQVDVAVPQVLVPSVRAAMGPAAATLLRRPVPRARDRRGHGHERQDDDGVPASLDPRGGGPAAGAADEHRAARRRRAAPDRAQHARVDRPAAAVPRDARRRRPFVRDGGDVDRGRPGTSRRHAVRRARLHEPHAGSPRLPRDDGGLLRGEARALRAGRARRRQRRRRVGEAARRRPAECADVHARRRPRRRRPEAARPLQPRERARRDLGGARARDRRGRDPRRDRGASPACRAGSSRSRPDSRSP